MKIVGTYSSKAVALSTARALRASGSKKYTWRALKTKTKGRYQLARFKKEDV